MSLRDIAKEVGCSHSGIDVMMLRGQSREGKPDLWTPRLGRLTANDREEILLGLQRDESMSEIARALGKSPSTVTSEVKVNGGQDAYRVWPAHVRARQCTQRPKPSKLKKGPLVTK
jgi:IS30 family transposase